MKILQLIYSLESGGAERFTVDLSNELSKNNEVLICTIFDDAIPSKGFYINSLSKALQFVSLKSKKGTSFSALFKLIFLVYRFKPEVIHVHLNTVNYAMVLTLFYRRCKYVHTIHNLANVDIGVGVVKYLKKFFYKRNIIIPITISPECKISFKEYLNIIKVKQISNGCSQPEKSSQFKSVYEEVTHYKVKTSDNVFIHIGRFHEQKNQQMLINVFNKLNQENYGYILLVIGAGFNSVDAEKLKSVSNNRIHFLGEKTNIKDYLFCSDIFVLTSLYEGLPISLLEAISCGIFAICTPAGGITHVLKDNKIGYLSKDFSEESYFKLLRKYLERKEEVDKDYIIDYFNDNFSIESCAKKYEQVYNH